ncbi:MAG: MoaD/ThiS family protein, partial [Rubrivivax sp.]
MSVTLQVRYFASLREALGPSESVSLENGATLGQLRDALLARGGRHAEVLARDR